MRSIDNESISHDLELMRIDSKKAAQFLIGRKLMTKTKLDQLNNGKSALNLNRLHYAKPSADALHLNSKRMSQLFCDLKRKQISKQSTRLLNR